MTKPIEETWTYDTTPPITTHGVSLVLPGRDIQFGEEEGPHGESWCTATETDVARARLAAQAPAMARLLLKVIADADDGGEVMSALGYKTIDEMRAVLRAAGVLP